MRCNVFVAFGALPQTLPLVGEAGGKAFPSYLLKGFSVSLRQGLPDRYPRSAYCPLTSFPLFFMPKHRPSNDVAVILQISKMICFSMDDSLVVCIFFAVLAFHTPDRIILTSFLFWKFHPIHKSSCLLRNRRDCRQKLGLPWL